MKVVPNWVILVITVLVFTIAFGGTWFLGRKSGKNEVELRVATERVVALEESAKRERALRATLEVERGRLRTVSQKLQESLGKKEVVYEEVTRDIIREIEKPVYRDLALPASGVQVLSDSADKFNATRPTKG